MRATREGPPEGFTHVWLDTSPLCDSTWACGECGAVVLGEQTVLHRAWHTDTKETAK